MIDSNQHKGEVKTSAENPTEQNPETKDEADDDFGDFGDFDQAASPSKDD